MTQMRGLGALIEHIRAMTSIEVIGYDNDGPIFKRYEGIIKGEIDKEDLGIAKKYKPRSKPTRTQIEVVETIATHLANLKIPFKILFEGKEVVIKLGNGFIRLASDGAKVAGFSSLEDEPIRGIVDQLRRLGRVMLLKALR